jgi:hypothetical protein
MVSTAQDIMSRYGIDQDFAASIESLGNDLGVDPMYLANTMYAESTLNPSEKNKAGSGAMGLIQFMPETAANLGTTTDELSRMTPVEQMEYVRRYFSADNLGAGRLRALRNDPSQHNVNMAVFLPSRIGKPVDTQIPQKYWSQNGSIRTPADYTRSAEERVNAYIQSNPADTQADTVDAQTDKMLFEEQPEDTFRPEVVPASLYTDAVISSTDEEALEVDDTLMAEHEEKIRRGKAPRGSKPTKEGGYYTEGEYGFRTNPEGEVVADLEVNSLENVVKSIGERLRTMLGNNEDSETLELNEGGLVESAREGVYSLGSRGAARELRDTVAKELGVYETSEEARSIANKYRLNVKETDTLRHILGAGLLKYIDKDFTQPLLLGTEVLDKLQVSLERLMDPNSEDIYRKSYYVQSIEEANRDIVNYQVGSALAKQYDTKDDFIKSAVKLVKDLGKGKTPVVVDKTLFGLVDIELTPQLSTGVVYNPDELKKRGVVYDPESGVMVSSRKVLSPPIPEPRPDPGYDPNYDATVSSRTVLSPPIPEPRPENLKKAEGGSVEKKVKFVKEDDDDVPDPPPGATPEEVADDIPAYLSTGEYVLPANVVRYIGLKNITGMHQRALSELQQMEDLDIIENVDENGYVEEDDDEMDYMKPEGVVEIVVAEHHPKGLMAMGFAEGGMINSDSSMEEGQVLPTSDIFSEGVYAQANIDRSVDSEDVVESDKVITAPVAFSSAPGKTAYLAYITPEEAASLRQAKQGFSSDGNGQEVSDGQYQHLGPKGLMSFNGQGGGDPIGGSGGGDPTSGPGRGPSDPSSPANTATGSGGGDPTSGPGRGPSDPSNPAESAFDRALKDFVKDFTLASLLEKAEAKAAEVNQEARDRGISVTDGTGYSGPAGSPPGPAFGGGDEGNDAGGSQEFPEEEKADTDTEKSTDTDPLSDYIYVPGVGYRRKIRSVKPLSELKAGGYVTRNGIMARGYSEGGDPGDGHGGGMSEFVEDLEPEDVEEEKPTDPYEGYTYVKGIGYVPTSRRATSIESASLALSSIFTPGFLNTIGLMGDPNEEL